MSADLQDMMAKLQVQLSTMNNAPSFAGLQAPIPTANVANALNALKQQSAVQQMMQPTGGQYGYLHDAGKQGFAQAGQAMGNMIGNAIGAAPGQSPQQPPPQMPQQMPQGAPAPGGDPSQSAQPQQPSGPPAPPGTPAYAQWYSQNVMQARALTNALVQQGKDPLTAQMQGLQLLASRGVPGATEELVKTQEAQTANLQKKAGADKDTAQAANFANESTNRDQNQTRETANQTWKTIATDPNGFYQLQQNGNGEVKRVELKPSMAALQSPNPDSVEAYAQLVAAGKVPALSGTAMRTPFGQNVMARVPQINPDYTSTTYDAGKATATDFSSKGKSGQAVKSFNTGLSHLDTLGQATAALNNGDMPAFNAAANAVATAMGGTAPSSFNAVRNIVSAEIVKAVSGSAGALADREEVKKDLSNAQSPQALQAVISKYQSLMAGQLAGLRTSYQNQPGKPQDFESKFLEPRAQQLVRAAPEYNSVFPTQPAAPAAPGGGKTVDFSSLK
jgi:hypothetical protein